MFVEACRRETCNRIRYDKCNKSKIGSSIMDKYYCMLVDSNCKELVSFIFDVWKPSSIRYAKEWMATQGIEEATLIVNSIKTSVLFDVIDIKLSKNSESNHPLFPETQQKNGHSTQQESPVLCKCNTIYVRRVYWDLPPNNFRRVTSTLSAEEFARFCKTRRGLLLLILSDYRPHNPQCEYV